MAVYVDDMRAALGRMVMCHMLADTDAELHAMADQIGVSRRWWQSPEKTSGSHYDISLSKRALAVRFGAVEISLRQAASMNFRRRITGSLGSPSDAEEWVRQWREQGRANLHRHVVPGGVRVVSKRRGATESPLPEEVVVSVDRTNPILGNRHRLADSSNAVGRLQVIQAFKNDLESDFARQGPMSRAIADLARRVANGERICLACWCAPLPCHGDVIAEHIKMLVSNEQVRT